MPWSHFEFTRRFAFSRVAAPGAKMNRTKTKLVAAAITLTTVVMILAGAASTAGAEEPAAPAAAAPAAPDLATRVADLEAYVTNGVPKAMTTTSGPGHNAWMMTSAAL